MMAAGRSLRPAARIRIVFACAVAALVVLIAFPDGGAAEVPPGEAVALGAWIPNSFEHPRQIDRYAQLVGRRPVIVSRYPNWSEQPFEASELNPIWRRGAVPLVTWEPWTSSHKGIPLRAIASGRYDGYARKAARAAAAWGHPILLRFAHEMNGTWYPWGRQDGNTPRLFVAAWRHLVDLFRATGASNVQWVWAPNVNEQAGPLVSWPLIGGGPSQPFPFRQYYPGDAWVDWAGLDGFNWGKTGEWQSFTQIFGSSYDVLTRLTPRPIIVTETASNERLGDKAEWLTSALRDEIPRFPRIRALIWFDEAFGGVSARVDSSPSALAALRAAVDSPRYGLSRSALLATPRTSAPGPLAPPAPEGGYGAPPLSARLWLWTRRHMPWSALGIAASLTLLGALGWLVATHTPRPRRARA